MCYPSRRVEEEEFEIPNSFPQDAPNPVHQPEEFEPVFPANPVETPPVREPVPA